MEYAGNILAHAGKQDRRPQAAFIATVFAQPDATSARVQWCHIANQMRPKLLKRAAIIDAAEEDVLCHRTGPRNHLTKLSWINSIECTIAEIKRRTRCRWHLSRRGGHHPPGRCDLYGAERRTGGSALPLYNASQHHPVQRRLRMLIGRRRLLAFDGTTPGEASIPGLFQHTIGKVWPADERGPFPAPTRA